MTTLSALLWRLEPKTCEIRLVALRDISKGDVVVGQVSGGGLTLCTVAAVAVAKCTVPVLLHSVFGARLLPGASCIFGGQVRAVCDVDPVGAWSMCDGVGHVHIKESGMCVMYDNVPVVCNLTQNA